jgi:hypothetical protein
MPTICKAQFAPPEFQRSFTLQPASRVPGRLRRLPAQPELTLPAQTPSSDLKAI